MKITSYALVSFGIMILMSASVMATKNIIGSFFFGVVVSLFIDWNKLGRR